MKKNFFEAAIGIGAASALFVAGFLVSIAIKIPPTQIGDAGTWAGAFFALLAFSGTIFLATRETVRRNREARLRARLVIPSIVMKLVALKPGIENAARVMKANPIPDRKLLRFVARQISTYKLWTADEVTPLTCLPEDCASQLILIREMITIVLHALRHPPDNPSIHYNDAIDQLERTLVLIELTRTKCEHEYHVNVVA